MISIGKLINKVLTDIPGISKAFPIIAEAGTNLPFAIYERDSINPNYSKDGLSGNEVTVTIHVLADSYKKSIELAEKVRTAFEFKQQEYAGIKVTHCTLENTDEGYNEYAFIQSLTFTFKTN